MENADLGQAASDYATANAASQANQDKIADLERQLKEARDYQEAVENSVKEAHAKLVRATSGTRSSPVAGQ